MGYKQNCILCGNEFEGRKRKYCSSECRKNAYYPLRINGIAKCHVCGNDYKKFLIKQKSCSRECSDIYWSKVTRKNKKQEYNLARRKREKIRRKIDPSFRINSSMRSIIYRALNGEKCGTSWQKLVGYSIKELKNNLKAKFKSGMTFDNYGEWHIDHIKPRSLFNYESYQDAEFKECWALDNLQPLWAKDNLSKKDKYNEQKS